MNKKTAINFDIITAFPEAFSYLDSSLLKRAQEKNLISVKIWNLRDFANDKHKTIDDRPYGGGPGMVLKIESLYKAIQQIRQGKREQKNNAKVILTDTAGKQFNQELAKKLSKEKNIIIICGHYEGVDERVKKFVDMSISVGPYILTGGELPAMTIIDAVSRHLEGVLGNPESLEEKRESVFERSAAERLAIKSVSEQEFCGVPPQRSPVQFQKDFTGRSVRRVAKFRCERTILSNRGNASEKTDSRLSFPAYTRPEIFVDKNGKKLKVPKVLLSGDHKKIAAWRNKHSKDIG